MGSHTLTPMRILLVSSLLLVLTACGGRETSHTRAVQSIAQCRVIGQAAPNNLQHFVGAMHEHSSYSDGDIHSRPADYYAAGKAHGLDFMAGSDHSDTLDKGVFISVGSDCFSTPDGLLTCLTALNDDTLAKWEATAEQAAAASDENFLAIRGFEWTSDRFGHINVYFSRNFSNAKTDLGYLVSLGTFWDWFTRSPSQIGLSGGSVTAPVLLGGGSDGLGQFNHPSDKCLSDGDPGCNWHDFELVPDAVERMFAMELYNGGGRDEQYPVDFVRALDKGWRLAPVGSEDEHETDWGHPQLAKTVTLASALNETAFRSAWMARRTYALVGHADLRIDLHADGQPMGSTLECASGSSVAYRASVTHADGRAFDGQLRLISNAGDVVAQTRGDSLNVNLATSANERYYFLRVNSAEGESLAFTAPVWIGTAQ